MGRNDWFYGICFALFFGALLGAFLFLWMLAVDDRWQETLKQGDHFYLDGKRYRCQTEREP